MLGTNLKCEPCGKVFTGDVCYEQHVASEKHKKKVAQLSGLYARNKYCPDNQSAFLLGCDERSESPDSDVKCKTEENYCKVCDLRFCSPDSHAQHIRSAEHCRKLMSEVSEELKVMEQSFAYNNRPTTEAAVPLEFYCEFCDCKCNSESQFQQHIQNSKHKKRQSAASKENDRYFLSSAASNIDDKLPVSHSGIYATAGVNVFTSNYRCQVCNISCTGLEPYEQHLQSKKHLKKLQNKQNGNVLEGNDFCMVDSSCAPKPGNHVMAVQDKSTKNSFCFRCEPCGMVFSGNIPYIDHVKSSGHQKKTLYSRLRKIEEANSNTDNASSDMPEMDDIEADSINSDVSCLDNSICDGIKVCDVNDLNVIIFYPDQEVTFDNLPSKMEH